MNESVFLATFFLFLWGFMTSLIWVPLTDVELGRKRGERGIDVVRRVVGDYAEFHKDVVKLYVTAIPKAIKWLVSPREGRE